MAQRRLLKLETMTMTREMKGQGGLAGRAVQRRRKRRRRRVALVELWPVARRAPR